MLFRSNSGWKGISPNPSGVPNPSRKATANSTSPFRYSRRYLDWNRATFEFHAVSNQSAAGFDSASGLATTVEITQYRNELHLGDLNGCAPQDYCQTCAPFGSPGSIFSLMSQALAEVVVDPTRGNASRYIISNTGGIRFDIYKGPFTYDDNFIVSPFKDAMLYIADVSCEKASTLLDGLNKAGASQKRNLGAMRMERDICVDPIISLSSDLEPRDGGAGHGHGHGPAVSMRQVADLVPGYTTTDDFGSDGDDTPHSTIPAYTTPDYYQGTAGLGAAGCTGVADVIFVDL